jgi:hypothetical protein
MMAEAENELNGPTNAYQYINKLMERARNANGVSRTTPEDFANLTQDELRQAIWKERNFELLGECHMWFDLIRTGQYENAISHYIQYEYDPEPAVQAIMTYYSRNVLFPIPSTEIFSNKLMTQNPGHDGTPE